MNNSHQEKEIIKKIENGGGKYDPTSSLSIDDQLFISNSINGSDNVKWNDNDTYKRIVNSNSTISKREAIKALSSYTYKTPPIKIVKSLEQLFIDYKTKDGHWLYIAQHWNPRAINRVIRFMTKLHNSKRVTIHNPPAYFTNLIKRRKRRKGL